ncbi:amino acid permease [Clostridium sp. CX1]|uniref:Amino acid permease n=1 Tax=Clostridium tanneri TaxID=3037988 RepID=A0ABU4JUN6_9CLOT|nr:MULTISPECIES: amino acid permease [unclassified Clostridium]MCT8976646.1 amino acid permease [Clostridium sp. CX1]MDW8801859.1 amino acid permease [Clostridium sp. A1-XYC3]
MEKKGNMPVLKREIKLGQATMLVVGIVIGSGVFFKPAQVFKNTGAPGLGILAWIVGCLITMAGALTIAEIGSAIPKTGGLFAYLKDLYGEKWAFLLGWVQTLIYYPGIDAALAVVFATQCTSFIDLTPAQQKGMAVGLIIFLTIVNLVSTKFGTKFAVLFTIGKLVPIGVIIVFGLLMGKVHNFTPMSTEVSTGAGFGAALLGVLFAYEGWIAVANMSEEMKNPAKDLPKAIVFGLTIITIAYLGVNLAIINTMPAADVAVSQKAASDAAVILFGPIGEKLIAAGILISITGCISAFIMTGARIPYAMAADNLFVFKKFFGKLTEKEAIPANAIIFESILACLYALSGSYDTLTDLAVFVMWLFFILGIFGVFVLRKNHKELISEDSYKVPFYPIVPIIGVAGALYVVISTLITGTENALFGLGVTLIGLPVYMYIKNKDTSSNSSASV